MKKVAKLKKAFMESELVDITEGIEYSEYKRESEKIELDNLDRAKLVFY